MEESGKVFKSTGWCPKLKRTLLDQNRLTNICSELQPNKTHKNAASVCALLLELANFFHTLQPSCGPNVKLGPSHFYCSSGLSLVHKYQRVRPTTRICRSTEYAQQLLQLGADLQVISCSDMLHNRFSTVAPSALDLPRPPEEQATHCCASHGGVKLCERAALWKYLSWCVCVGGHTVTLNPFRSHSGCTTGHKRCRGYLACLAVCVCVSKRERERAREYAKRVCVCVSEREKYWGGYSELTVLEDP